MCLNHNPGLHIFLKPCIVFARNSQIEAYSVKEFQNNHCGPEPAGDGKMAGASRTDLTEKQREERKKHRQQHDPRFGE
jgi:hypothetical protein